MSRNLTRVWPVLVLAFASEAWALGLGDIRLSSALNEPLRAEIVLLSATPEELDNLKVSLASADSFSRYGLDRPLFLQKIQFRIIKSGGIDGSVITLTSVDPVKEPFITLLVEATWSRGRLLREYTLLLDPPTFAPPPVAESKTAVTAPQQSTQADSGRIERPSQAPPTPPPARPPQIAGAAQSAPSRSEPMPAAPFDTTGGGDHLVTRGETLWGIAKRYIPDSRLTMNQMMLAIFEANPEAFAGNINIMSAGASLRIPSADEIFRINRRDAFNEVRRQTEAWSGAAPGLGRQPSLVLVPPDDEQTGYDRGVQTTNAGAGEPSTDERISQLEQEIAEQESLFEINDDELAALRAELARLRGEEYVEPEMTGEEVGEVPAGEETTIETTEEPLAEEDTGISAEEAGEEIGAEGSETVEETEPETTTMAPPRVVMSQPSQEPGLIDRALQFLNGFWGILIGIFLVVLVLLVWFARRAARGGDEDSTGVWDALDADELDGESLASTERLRALAREDDTAIVVVEQQSAAAAPEPAEDAVARTIETPAAADEMLETTGENAAMEDTFSSETAINLDQSDPVAEADFHMAYGLYDQAADLINGALVVEPEREDLLSKLCEIYFVWGNRDAFVDAASRLRSVLGTGSNPEWDKIAIMGQQIAADHEMFSGAAAGRGATRSVDLSFEGAMDEESELDMDLAGDAAASDVIDLGEGGDDDLDLVLDTTGSSEAALDSDFFTDTDATAEVAPAEDTQETAEMPGAETPVRDASATGSTPTIEDQFRVLEETGELPSISDDEATRLATLDEDEEDGRSDSTAEIELDDLGLDLEGLAETGLAADLDDTTEREALEVDDDLVATGSNQALEETEATGANPELDEDLLSGTGIRQGLNIEDALAATGETEVADPDATGRRPLLDEADDMEDTDVGVEIDTSLLDATGQTQVLSGDYAVETASDVEDVISDQDKTLLAGFDDDTMDDLGGDAETVLAPLDDDDDVTGESPVLGETEQDFDFAKTEALPKDVFTGMEPIEDTGELPGIAGTDMDLDLDDLTAALRVSEVGDTVDQPRDDATVQHRRPGSGNRVDLDVGETGYDDDDEPTARLAPEDVSGDLHDARTMTEVGTKLDLARAYVDMGDPGGARSILEEVLDEGDDGQRQQAQQLLDSLPG